VTERDGLVTERNSLENERDNLVTVRDSLVSELNNLIAERDGLLSERGWLISERNNLTTEREGLINSRSWRFTKFLRDIGVIIRRNKVLYFFAKCLLSIKRRLSTSTQTEFDSLAVGQTALVFDKPKNINNKEEILTPVMQQNKYQNTEQNHEKKIAFTICSLNYLHMALSARESFLLHNPDWDFTIIIHDMITNPDVLSCLSKLASEDVNIMYSLELKNYYPSLPIEEIFIRYNVYEGNTAIKPYVFSHFFEKNYNKVCYFVPDILFYDTIEEIDRLLDKNDIILTPHTLVPFPEDGKGVGNQDINNAGIYNCGFVAIASDCTKNVLNFWMEQLRIRAYSKPSEGLFTDQIWANWFPVISDKCFILKKLGFNTAYWNLHERTITNMNGKWYVNGEPLVFFHFSGIVMSNINSISKHQNRYTLVDREPDLKRLFEEYSNTLFSNYFNIFGEQDYFFNTLPHKKLLINSEHRKKMIKCFLETGFNPFCGEGGRNVYITKRLYSRYNRINFPRHPLSFLKSLLFTRKQSFGINIFGYFSEMHSIGEVARQLVKKIYTTGIPFSIFEINSGGTKISTKDFAEFKLYSVQKTFYPINIFVINADQMPIIYNMNKNLFKNRINLGN
jgi:hypothetical protein